MSKPASAQPSRLSPLSLPSAGASALPTLRQLLVVLLITLQLSWMLSALSGSAFWSVLIRVAFIGFALLFVYTKADTLRIRWLPHSLVRLLCVVVGAPLATFVIFVVTESTPGLANVGKSQLVKGYIILAIFSSIVGLLVALIAMRLERRTREAADRLRMEHERTTLERDLLDARLRLLQAQIEPHFLFNTLANIQALVEAKSDNAAPVLRHLIAYLRAVVPTLGDADAVLATELKLVRAYLELMHLRMPDRLTFSVEAPPELQALAFPAMALLTVVENAVRHGIDPSIDGGRIEVGGRRDPITGLVTLWVADTGVGIAELAQPGTGLANLRARLQAFYGPAARLELHEAAPHGLQVELHFYPRSVAA